MRQTKKALHWINNLLKKHHIRFIIFGGFAAKIYGSRRELADIDIAIDDKYLDKVNQLVKIYAVRDLKRYKDLNWDSRVITINYAGQEIDIISIQKTKIFNKLNKKWQRFEPYLKYPKNLEFMGERILVTNKSKLIEYKKELLRRVDKKDVALIA